jgi:ABC-type antimicrobial peptide transport system permease subunit
MQHDVSSIFPSLKQDLLNTGVIENVALSDHATINGGNTDTRFTWQGKDKGQEIYIAHRSVSPEYVSTSGMQIIEGRDFSDNTVLEANSLIITQSMARLMGKETAVGKIIQSSRNNKEGVFTNMTVIGVISDYVYGNVYGQPGPVLFFCRIHKDSDLAYVRMKPGNTENALNKIERVMKKDNPGYPLQYRFVDDQFNKKFLNEVLISKVSSVFAVLAIVISCLGLFGLAAYTAAQRTKEIGIRKVLGASITGLTRLLSKDFLQLVIIACMIAFPVAWWMMSEWLQSYQYRISISWWIFPLTCLVAILIALLTISFHAIKTAMANPVNSLRSE